MYALPAWYGQLSQSQSDTRHIKAMFRRARRWQLTNRKYTIQELAKQADKQCFNYLVTRINHCLQQLLPSLKPDRYQLRARGHPLSPPFYELFHI